MINKSRIAECHILEWAGVFGEWVFDSVDDLHFLAIGTSDYVDTIVNMHLFIESGQPQTAEGRDLDVIAETPTAKDMKERKLNITVMMRNQ